MRDRGQWETEEEDRAGGERRDVRDRGGGRERGEKGWEGGETGGKGRRGRRGGGGGKKEENHDNWEGAQTALRY